MAYGTVCLVAVIVIDAREPEFKVAYSLSPQKKISMTMVVKGLASFINRSRCGVVDKPLAL